MAFREKTIVLFLLALLLSSCGSSKEFRAASKTPRQDSQAVIDIVKRGIELHDKGNYAAAIEEYNKALKLNPDSPLALYEISYSYYAQGKYQESLEYTRLAAEYKSDNLVSIYLQMGSNLDLLGKPNKAVKAYQSGLEIAPDHPLLHYNLGITYTGMGERRNAISAYKQAVVLNPNHSSSHLALAREYAADNYRIPSLLSYCRFFILEPKSNRTAQALMEFQKLLTSSVERKSEKEINVFVPDNSPTYDGDFASIDILLSLQSSIRLLDKPGKTEPITHIVRELGSIFSILQEQSTDSHPAGFVWNYYVPYFAALHEKEFVPAFVYFIFQMSNDEGIQTWLATHDEEIQEMLIWSETFDFTIAQQNKQ